MTDSPVSLEINYASRRDTKVLYIRVCTALQGSCSKLLSVMPASNIDKDEDTTVASADAANNSSAFTSAFFSNDDNGENTVFASNDGNNDNPAFASAFAPMTKMTTTAPLSSCFQRRQQQSSHLSLITTMATTQHLPQTTKTTAPHSPRYSPPHLR